ncbi:MAG: ATP-binding cassette domain-containing protein, partial [Theionarchaea archaeon]|nr:ATP-binding cassette domain-containing protein [Theionarchaea archaeon]
CQSIEGRLPKTILVDQSPIGRNPRSNPATYTKLADVIRDIFASKTDLTRSHFSFNRSEGACAECKGIGAKEVRMRYMPSTWIPCQVCSGRRFSEEVLDRKAVFGERELDIAEFYELSVEEIRELLLECGDVSMMDLRNAMMILDSMVDIGLGYLSLGQPSPTLSGGEAQRIKLVKFLARRSLSRQLMVLDEPSTGLHPADVSGLLVIFDRLVRNGATILVVEHDRDILRAADWVIDLGPGAGPEGGRILYSGSPDGLVGLKGSMTGRMLIEKESSRVASRVKIQPKEPGSISIRHARAHNLKNVNVDFPKGALTVVTGVSGSGKSSLVIDVLEAEARRRYLESLSMYERQGLREGPEAPVGAITGLGVTVSIDPGRRLHGRRATVGALTEISHHLSNMLSWLGERDCPRCGKAMVREGTFTCPSCGERIRIPDPSLFISSTYAAACMKCHGVGTTTVPEPDKLIVRPDRPICDGAMYSPGFFPKGYLCKPFNWGYYLLQALASRYGFDPAGTPWNEMSEEARNAFLYGDQEPMKVFYESRGGRKSTSTHRFPGFFRWVGDWDFGGTYTRQEVCSDCGGGRLRPEYLAVRLGEYNMAQMSEMTLSDLEEAIAGIDTPENREHLVGYSLRMALRRLRFLIRVGLGYLNLNRLTLTLSAGEAERIRLASLLGGGLTSLTVLVDEPSRGLHPSEVGALANALRELVSEGNTAIVVEHDPVLIRAADNIVDMGPGSGSKGGEVVAVGTPEEVSNTETPTGRWLRGMGGFDASRTRRRPRGWMKIVGARENNLKGDEVAIPLGTVTGICGVSGSGKSTLIIDTLGRVLAPRKQTTSVAHEPVRPGAHESIEGAPGRVILVDQVKRGVTSPANFLGLDDTIRSIFVDSEDAAAMGLGENDLGRRCTECGGSGVIKEDMGFLPTVHSECEACRGTGFPPEIWDVRFRGYSLPEVFSLTIDEVLQVYGDYQRLSRPLEAARDVGLGYLMLRQPAFSLSGGEAQRLKISRELSRQSRTETLFILDEPTIGQHMEDIARLASVLHILSDLGHTVIVIEHQSLLLASCDWLVEMGPGGGPEGGYVIASGTPEEIAGGETPTACYIRDVLEGRS